MKFFLGIYLATVQASMKTLQKYLWVFLCWVLVACQHGVRTIQDHESIPVKLSAHVKAYQYYLFGEHASHHGHPQEALGHFTKANHEHKSSPLDYRIAFEHTQNGEFNQALLILDNILKDNPDAFYPRILRAKIFASQSDYVRSKRDFVSVLSHPRMLDVSATQKIKTQLALVTLYIENKDLTAASQVLSLMEFEDPHNELVFYYQARVATEKGNMKTAQQLYEKTVSLNSDFILAHRALALIHDYNNEADQKLTALEEIVRIDSSDIHTRTLLIHHYMKGNQPSLVRKHEAYFENRFEQDSKFCFELGLFYMEQKIFDQATHVFSRCKNVYPGDNQIAYYQGLNLYYMKRFDKAMLVFSNIGIASSFYEKSILARTSILRELNKDKEAENLFKTGIRTKPLAFELPLHFARYQMQKNNDVKAKTIIGQALKKFRDQSESFRLLLAEIYEKEKAFDKMEVELKKILAKNPSSSSALNFLGYSYADRNINIKDAEAHILQALELKPTDPYIQDSLAWVYYRKGQYKKAIQVVEMALQSLPNEWVFWDHYGDILIKVNDRSAAQKAYQRALTLVNSGGDREKLLKKIQAHKIIS